MRVAVNAYAQSIVMFFFFGSIKDPVLARFFGKNVITSCSVYKKKCQGPATKDQALKKMPWDSDVKVKLMLHYVVVNYGKKKSFGG